MFWDRIERRSRIVITDLADGRLDTKRVDRLKIHCHPGATIWCLDSCMRLFYSILRPGNSEWLRCTVLRCNTAPYSCRVDHWISVEKCRILGPKWMIIFVSLVGYQSFLVPLFRNRLTWREMRRSGTHRLTCPIQYVSVVLHHLRIVNGT